MFYTILVILLVLVSLALIGMVLLQQGKGADAGASFGGGASGTVFGSRGPSTFLSRTTAILATLFFTLATLLAYLANHDAKQSKTGSSVVERLGKKTDDKKTPNPLAPTLNIPAPNANVSVQPEIIKPEIIQPQIIKPVDAPKPETTKPAAETATPKADVKPATEAAKPAETAKPTTP